jgi:hypothetical protein
MNPDEAGPARVLRYTGVTWVPVGPVLPPIDDEAMHDDRAHLRRVTYWHLPVGLAERGDRLVCRERAWEFTDRCGPHHHAVIELANYFRATVDELLKDRAVWAMRPVTAKPHRHLRA